MGILLYRSRWTGNVSVLLKYGSRSSSVRAGADGRNTVQAGPSVWESGSLVQASC